MQLAASSLLQFGISCGKELYYCGELVINFNDWVGLIDLLPIMFYKNANILFV